MQEWANEKRAYDLLAQLSKQLKRDIKKTFEAVGRPLLEKHGLVYPILIEIAKGEQSYLQDLKLDKKIQTALLSFLEKRIKLPKVEINAKMSLETRDPNGINIIKDVLKQASGDAKKTGALVDKCVYLDPIFSFFRSTLFAFTAGLILTSTFNIN